MTRTHAARQLLSLGPISFAEFVNVTGWPYSACRSVLTYLVDTLGQATRADGLYWIANGKQLPDMRPLEAKAEPSNGETPNGPMRTETSMAVLPAAAHMRKTQAGS